MPWNTTFRKAASPANFGGMTDLPDFEPSATRLRSLLPVAADSDLAGPTTCERYSLGQLLAHIEGLTAAFRASAEKDFGPLTDTDPSSELPVLKPGWRDRIDVQLSAMVDAWQEPSAWDGMTRAGGADLPAQVMGIVALNEITLHGWDLARALGRGYVCDDATAEACLQFVSQAAGQDGGPFGPPRPVSDTAPVFQRVLALSGRDTSWRPGSRRPADLTFRATPAGGTRDSDAFESLDPARCHRARRTLRSPVRSGRHSARRSR